MARGGGRDTDGRQPRRYLVVIGVSEYEKLPGDQWLPGVTNKDVRLIPPLLEDFGDCEWVLRDLACSPTRLEIETQLTSWLADADRSPDDILVLYFAGHGAVTGDRHYIYARDTAEALPGDAIESSNLGTWLANATMKGRLKAALVVVNACYSDAATGAIGEAMESFKRDPRSQALLASARGREESLDGVFAEAVDSAVREGDEELRRDAGPGAEWLRVDDLARAVNRRFARALTAEQRVTHEAVARLTATGTERIEFIRNPRYVPAPEGLDVESHRRLAAVSDDDRRQHFQPSVYGVEDSSADYFTGRTAALREITRWLDLGSEEARAAPMLVVTGGPGSGKSAVVGRIAYLSDPVTRSRLRIEDLPPDTVPEPNAITLALWARAKTSAILAAELADRLDLGLSLPDSTSPARVVEAIRAGDRRYTLVVDALDEASLPGGEAVASDLLRPLCATGRVRILVGTRRRRAATDAEDGLLRALGVVAEPVLDLDDRRFIEVADIAGYVERRLIGAEDPTLTTPYRDQPAVARTVASAVAAEAFPTFLIARMASRALLAMSNIVDVAREGWQQGLPSSPAAAMDFLLEKVEDNNPGTRQRNRDLLAALAWAQGNGLPWREIWPAVARGVTGRRYDEDDIEALLAEAGSLVVESTESGRSVFRLFHQALADHFHGGDDDQAPTERRILAALVATVPTPSDGHPDWAAAHDYVRSHIATHAARAGVLDELVLQPLFLLNADPGRLLAALPSVQATAARDAAHIYQLAVHHLREAATLEERAAYLGLAAAKAGIDPGDPLTALAVRNAWVPKWARWQPTSTNRVVDRLQSWERLKAVTNVDGLPIAIIAGEGGRGRFVNLNTGETRRVTWPPEPIDEAMAVGLFDGELVGVIRGARHLHVWDLSSGEVRSTPTSRYSAAATAMALAETERGGVNVAVVGYSSGELRALDLETGDFHDEPLGHFVGRIESVAVADLDGAPIAVATVGKTLCLWSLRTRAPIGRPLCGHDHPVKAVALTTTTKGLVAVSADTDGAIRLWDLRKRKPQGKALRGHKGPVNAVAVTEADGSLVAVSAGGDGAVRVWDLSKRKLRGELFGHEGEVRTVGIVGVNGKHCIVSAGDDGTVRLWDLAAIGRPGESRLGHQGTVSAVAITTVEGQSRVVSGGFDGALRVWDLATGAGLEPGLRLQRPRPFELARYGDSKAPVELVDFAFPWFVQAVGRGSRRAARAFAYLTGPQTYLLDRAHRAGVYDIATAEVWGEPIVISGGGDGELRMWNVRTARPAGRRMSGHGGRVRAVSTTAIDGEPVAMSSADDGTLRLWNLRTGEPRWTVRTGKPRWGVTSENDDGPATAAALSEVDGEPVAITAGPHWQMHLRSLRSGTPRGEPLRRHKGWVAAIAATELDGEPVAVSGGFDGTLRLWSLRTGEFCRTLGEGPRLDVFSLALTELNGEPLAISGHKGGRLGLWNLRTGAEILAIDLDSSCTAIAAEGASVVVGCAQGLVCIELNEGSPFWRASR